MNLYLCWADKLSCDDDDDDDDWNIVTHLLVIFELRE